MSVLGDPGPVDPGGEGSSQYAKGYTGELDPLAEHGHRPKHRASLRHPTLEMKILGGVVVVVAAAAILVPVLF